MPSKKDRVSRRPKRVARGQPITGKTKEAAPAAAGPVEPVSAIGHLGRVWERIGRASRLAEFRVSCVRPDDLVVCDFVFEGLRLELVGEGAPKLVRQDPQSTATLIVELPPQSFGEQAFLDKTGETPGEEVPANLSGPEKFPETSPDPAAKAKNVPSPGEQLPPFPSAKIRMAGRSRIAFSMPAEETELAFTVEAILGACRRWPMRLDVNAVPDPPRVRFGDLGFRDPWFVSVVASSAWQSATQALVESLGGAHRQPLADAARRISTKAVEVIRSGSTRGMAEMLRRALDEELDVLGSRFPPLRDAERRESAAAALSLMATRALAMRRVGPSILDFGRDLPFLSFIFGPHEPAHNVTALELPYRLILSPVPESGWHHATKPVERRGRTELWHTRLTSAANNTGPDEATNVRALWSPDYERPDVIGLANATRPFRMSLDPLDRQMLVKLMAGFDELTTRNRAFRPRTARARRLALSSLGALLDVEGHWQPPVPQGVGLEQWRHLATLGRDHYVRVVYRGFLKGLRHAASLVKVTERKFEFLKGTKNRVAVLRQRFFIVVRERVKRYDGTGHAYDGRNFPFTEVEILTRVTPTLRAPDQPECQLDDPAGIIYGPATGVPHRACFWPMLTPTEDFLFQIAATDLSGARVTFAMPLLFVGVEANEHPDPNVMAEIIKRNNEENAIRRRRATLGNAAVCYAPIKPGAKGDPRLPTSAMTFRAAPVKDVPLEEAQFYPEVEKAEVGIPAIQRLLQKTDPPVAVEYPDIYKTTPGGFGPGNPGELFLKLQSERPLVFGDGVKSDAIGGLATPSMAILGLSRVMGPVAAQPPPNPADIESRLGDIIADRFNPADFFKGAKILGGVGLDEILDLVPGLDGDNVPKLLSRDLPDRMEASFTWTTAITHGDVAKGLFVPNAGGATTLEMNGVVSAPLAAPAATTFSATASIVHFKVNLFGFVTVWFDRLRFSAKTGAKPDVTVDLHPGEQAVEFGGPLEFVNELRTIIPSNGFSDPPALTVTPSGVSASYSINIPSLTVGIFALEHLSLGAGFLLPFDARPAEVRFNFAERQRPFSLTVSLLGGGGFFAIAVGTEGVREIEAALEFGAALSIDLGVASGGVEIKAGVYFHWKTKSLELAGYVRLHGELSVLGLISASLTFNLQLAYLKENGQSVVWGEAILEVEIEILFLSFSVSVKCRREFAGSAGDPKFVELIPDQATWDHYCQAFAAEAA